MFTAASKNLMLDACGVTHLSLHSGYPGLAGASELAGGSPAYARKAVSFAAAASGEKDASTSPVFDVPPVTTVRWVGFWDAAVGGNFLGFAPNGGEERELIVDTTTNKVLYAAHGYSNGDKVVAYGNSVPAPLAAGTIYYVVNAGTDDFQLAATAGGAAIDLTALGSYDCVMSEIVEEAFGAQGQHQVTALSLNLNG